MKHKGNISEIGEMCADDFYATYKRILDRHFSGEDTAPFTARSVITETINSPASRYWVSEERANQVVCTVLKGTNTLDKMMPERRKMYEDIISQVKDIMNGNPDMSICDAVHIVLERPAPRFYVTESYAIKIISKKKLAWFLEKKHKLRHLFM